MRVLVTGADGFVGRHLSTRLEAHGHQVERWVGPGQSPVSHPAVAVDVRDWDAVNAALRHAKPDALVHLAAISSVAASHADPGRALTTNGVGTANVLRAVRDRDAPCTVLLVSSGEVYGAASCAAPATEDGLIQPLSPYAVSKLAMELIGSQFARSYGMKVVCARPFNHIGRGQSEDFAIPSFAAKIAAFERTRGTHVLAAGNLEPVRDFSHVSDVVSAYELLLDRGKPGETYNIASGRGQTIRSMLLRLAQLAGVALEVTVDPAKMRPVDIPYLVGSAGKLRALGWIPERTVDDALEEVLRDARDRRGL